MASHVAALEKSATSNHFEREWLVFSSNSGMQHAITDSYSCSRARSTRKTGSESHIPAKVSAPCVIPRTTNGFPDSWTWGQSPSFFIWNYTGSLILAVTGYPSGPRLFPQRWTGLCS